MTLELSTTSSVKFVLKLLKIGNKTRGTFNLEAKAFAQNSKSNQTGILFMEQISAIILGPKHTSHK